MCIGACGREGRTSLEKTRKQIESRSPRGVENFSQDSREKIMMSDERVIFFVKPPGTMHGENEFVVNGTCVLLGRGGCIPC